MGLQSIIIDNSNVLLNHGQHLDVPCLVKDKNIRFFVGFSTEIEYCQIDWEIFEKLQEKIKIIRIKPANAPKFLRFPQDPQPLSVNKPISLG